MRAIRSKMVLKARFRSVPVCSAVSENRRECAAQADVFLSTRVLYDPPTLHREFIQRVLDIDLAIEIVNNVDHFGELRREEEKLVVWTHAEG